MQCINYRPITTISLFCLVIIKSKEEELDLLVLVSLSQMIINSNLEDLPEVTLTFLLEKEMRFLMKKK